MVEIRMYREVLGGTAGAVKVEAQLGIRTLTTSYLRCLFEKRELSKAPNAMCRSCRITRMEVAVAVTELET